eukprot:jgi/Psemu1/322063/estExt_fgenesh1_pg.C_180037
MKEVTVTIDLDRNMIWEVERVCPHTEKSSYWWSKPQLKQFRKDYQNEVMLEGIRNLVRSKIKQQFDDPDTVEERVDKIMKLEPADIADFLQTKQKPKPKVAPTLAPKVSDNDKDNDDSGENSKSDSDSSSPSEEKEAKKKKALFEKERKAQLVADHRIYNHVNDKEANETAVETRSDKNPPLEPSVRDEDGGDSLSTSASTPSFVSFDDHSLLLDDLDDDDEQLLHPPSHENTGTSESEGKEHSTPERSPMAILEPTLLDSGSHHGKYTQLRSASTTTPFEIITTQPQNSHKIGDDYLDDIDALRRRFRQGALAVVAMERLKKMVEKKQPPGSQEMWSSSSRLLDMYTASDDEEEEEEEEEENPGIMSDEEIPTPSAAADDDSDIEIEIVSSDDSDDDEDYSTESGCSDDDELVDCPVCRGLVDPAQQQRQIILLRQTLCRRCFYEHYLEDGEELEIKTNTGAAAHKRKHKNKHKSLCLTSKEFKHIELNTKRDVRILKSLAKASAKARG